jgi:hypothetical protein
MERGNLNPTWHKLGTVSRAMGFSMSRLVDEAEVDARIASGARSFVSELEAEV